MTTDPFNPEQIFDEALKLGAGERETFLDAECAGDESFKAKVRALLDAHDKASSDFLEMPTAAGAVRSGDETGQDEPESRASVSVPGYRIVRELHRGGQGIVYQAIQESTTQRVAIKVALEGPFASKADRARFEREVKVLGQLSHPHIVAIHDSGASSTGFYFVMDFVDGLPLDEHIRARSLSTKQVLQLFAKICDAVNAAHLRGVIHRDLKPSNIRVDDAGEPHILDFGLAKVATDGAGVSAMTITGQFVGSLPWASPEQAEGRSDRIDIRTDVYSLGVILFTAITGAFPYDVTGNLREVLDRIIATDPARPSSLSRHVNDEVETIVLTCLQKDRSRRYQSAGELGRDVQSYLDGRPIQAKRDSIGYLLRKQITRHRVAVALALGYVAVTTIGFVAGFFFAYGFRQQAMRERDAAIEARAMAEQARDAEVIARARAEHAFSEADAARLDAEVARQSEATQRLVAETNAATANAAKQFLQNMLTSIDPSTVGARDMSIRFVLDEAVQQLDGGSLRHEPTVEAEIRLTIGRTYRALGLYGPAEENLRKGLKLQRQLHGDSGHETLKAVEELAALLTDKGQYQEAAALLTASLEVRRTRAEDQDLFAAVNLLGDVQWLQGRAAEAELSYAEALEGRREILGDGHEDTLRSVSNLGVVLQTQGRFAEAEPYFREALEGFRRMLGDDHPDTLNSINNIGGLLLAQGRLVDAQPYYRETLDGFRRVLGDDHPDTLSSIRNMGYLLDRQGKPSEAEQYFREALEASRRVLGDEHPSTLGLISNMGTVLNRQEQLAEAEQYYRDALEGNRRVLGDMHPNTLMSTANMAMLMQKQGDLEGAERLLSEAIRGYVEVLGFEHPTTLIAVGNLANVLQEQGKLDDTEASSPRRAPETGAVITLVAPNSNATHAGLHLGDVILTYGGEKITNSQDLGRAIVKLTDSRHADPSVGDVPIEIWRDGETITVMLAPGRIGVQTGRGSPRETRASEALLQLILRGKAGAESVYRAALSATSQVLGEDHPQTTSILIDLGGVLEDKGELKEAEGLLLQAVDSRLRVLGPEHPSVAEAVLKLIQLYEVWQKPEEAAHWREKLPSQ